MRRDYQIIDEGAKWIAPYIRRIVWQGEWGGCIPGWIWTWALRHAYEAGLRDEDRCPPSSTFREETPWMRQHLNAAFMMGLNDKSTQTKLEHHQKILASCPAIEAIEDIVTDSQLAARGLYVRPRVLLLKNRND